MSREITSHKVNGLNEVIKIKTIDEPGPGGANHEYGVFVGDHDRGPILVIKFQNGPLKETIPNGLSNEALLAIVEDRLKSFQAGPFACRENALALTHLQTARMWLQERTRDRMSRDVEGTSNK